MAPTVVDDLVHPEKIPRVVELLDEGIAGLKAVYLFGSMARGGERPDSDVDIAVLPAAPLEPLERWEIQERLATALGRDVDLVDLLAASAVMKVQVLEHGRLISDRDPRERGFFEMHALSDYARLQEERRGIIEDIRDRGSVHG